MILLLEITLLVGLKEATDVTVERELIKLLKLPEERLFVLAVGPLTDFDAFGVKFSEDKNEL